MPLKIVEGWTGAVDFDLLSNGVADPAASTGDVISLVLKTRDGIPIATTGNVSLQASTSSGGPAVYYARFLPDATDLQAKNSPYTARYLVTRAGRVVAYPSADADVWTVVTQ